MHLGLVTNPTPEWIIGEDLAAGDAWLVHARSPRFTARVHQACSASPADPVIRLDCGLMLVEFRWLGVPGPLVRFDELMLQTDRVLAVWLQRQLTRASRVA